MMKSFGKIGMLALTLMATLSCGPMEWDNTPYEPDPIFPEFQKPKTVVFTANVATKTILNEADNSVTWESGDRVKFVWKDGFKTSSASTSGAVTTFEVDIPAVVEELYAVYPAELEASVVEDGKKKGETMAIFYNTRKVRLLDWGTYWLSETPDKPSRGWDADCKRTATWTLMEMKDSGRKFFYVNTHLDHRGDIAQQKGLELIVERIAAMNPEGLPMILTGDFNVKPEDPVLGGLNAKMLDARKTALKTDSRATFNAWGKSASIIDYIYYSGFTECAEYETIVRQYKGVLYISDHYPIVSRLVF
jgi:endonuclease/exonuclease/phosphatase family metal-dependent hydrolase